ncbi:MAG: sigma-54-dependent Fis family transcriptional regulator [Pyrinomonadaceae bacterium]|nr:sigma-54-dependent Fis family transcriptional regulator [Pyrinomonadaceae bacterium]
MDTQKILLLNFDSEGELAKSLTAILETGLSRSVQLQLVCASLDESSPLEPVPAHQQIAHARAALLILVLSQSQLKRAKRWIELNRRKQSEQPIIVIAEVSAPEELLELLNCGAADFITPPLKSVEILPRIWRVLQQAHQSQPETNALKEKLGMKQLIGESPALLAETKKIPLIARCDASVLISGETGTGKELCARAIHYLSPRSDHPFLPVNCGAIPTELVENELFGHERGAFTDAYKSQPGLIQMAAGGTLFLDEIDCLPLLAQVKLLRFLQEKEYMPLGSARTCKVDVRVIAASNAKIEEAVSAGKLRPDLFYRLNTIPLALPPLRDRREDIATLVRHFLTFYSKLSGDQPVTFSDDAIEMLMRYEWPGNVRELEHLIERTIVLSEHKYITAKDLSFPFTESSAQPMTFQQEKAKFVAQFERTYIQGLLLTHKGNITSAARAACKNRRAFWQLIRKHQIDVRSFKSTS